LVQVVAAGEAVLERAGWAGLSMRAVATRLAVDPMTLYRHVSSREALVIAIAAERCRALDVDQLRFRRGTTWQQRLKQVAGAYLRCIGGAPELVRALTASSDDARQIADRWLAIIAELLAETRARPALVRQVAHTVADLVHGSALAANGGETSALRRSLNLLIPGIEARLTVPRVE